MKDWDHSYPRESAERWVNAQPGVHGLDELARRLSLVNTEQPVSVRDVHARPVAHSRVYFRGEAQGWAPYLLGVPR